MSGWKQLKTILMDKNGRKRLIFCTEAISSKRKEKGKLGHVMQICVCRLLWTRLWISLLIKNISDVNIVYPYSLYPPRVHGLLTHPISHSNTQHRSSKKLLIFYIKYCHIAGTFFPTSARSHWLLRCHMTSNEWICFAPKSLSGQHWKIYNVRG